MHRIISVAWRSSGPRRIPTIRDLQRLCIWRYDLLAMVALTMTRAAGPKPRLTYCIADIQTPPGPGTQNIGSRVNKQCSDRTSSNNLSVLETRTSDGTEIH